jgi:hypothetical protein
MLRVGGANCEFVCELTHAVVNDSTALEVVVHRVVAHVEALADFVVQAVQAAERHGQEAELARKQARSLDGVAANDTLQPHHSTTNVGRCKQRQQTARTCWPICVNSAPSIFASTTLRTMKCAPNLLRSELESPWKTMLRVSRPTSACWSCKRRDTRSFDKWKHTARTKR